MCWECDHPDRTRADYLAELREIADRTGWAVQSIERWRDRPPWSYTLGLSQFGRPELVVTGMEWESAVWLLDGAAGHMMHAADPVPGEQVAWEDGPLTEVVTVAEPWAHLNMAVELYGPKIRALQLVHADDHGHWPWDAYFRGVQPVLGSRAPHSFPYRADLC
jgi:Domain of unknown function (DUF4262)